MHMLIAYIPIPKSFCRYDKIAIVTTNPIVLRYTRQSDQAEEVDEPKSSRQEMHKKLRKWESRFFIAFEKYT